MRSAAARALALRWSSQVPVTRLTFVVAIAVSVLITPFLAMSAVENVRSHSRLSNRAKASWGADLVDLAPRAFSEAEARIPIRATYYVTVTAQVTSFARMSFIAWTNGAFLPRVAVRNPGDAHWIVSWGSVPRLEGVKFVEVRRLASEPRGIPVFVGRVVGSRDG